METRRKQRELINSNHSHMAMMAKTDQIVAAASGILNVSAHANAPQSGVPKQFRSRSTFLAQRCLQAKEGMFKQKELS
uniref:Uncharacterized protein n=1 Tax=mine drainage metagenome TaxID=410659 RepID=E6PY55_9ZZZZ